MQTSNANKYRDSNNPVWQFLAEQPLSEFLSDHDNEGELTAGLLFQTMRELGIPLEYIKNIDMTMTGFAKEALVHFKRGSLELPGRIRVFCQKKLVDDANSTKTANPGHAEQTMEGAAIKYPSGTTLNGGWGFFIVEKARHFPAGSTVDTPNFYDLYLYQEGE